MRPSERPATPAELRRRAEERLGKRGREEPPPRAPEDVLRLIHQLQVHQIELEIQNEELRRVRDELEVSLARYSELYDFAPVGYVTLDGKSTILEINLVGARMLGKERTLLVGQRFRSWVTPATRPVLERLLGARQKEERASCELTLSSGEKEPMRVRVDTVSESSALPGEWRCRAALTDITEQHRLREQFQEAQKMESIGRMAGGVAHDFNNLLTAILGSTEILRADLDSGKQINREDLEIIHCASTRASALTHQLLAVAHHQIVVSEPLDLNGVVGETVKLLRRLLPENIVLQTSLHPDLWMTLCDATQIQQIVMNLAVNARDAMPAGGRLTIETANVELDEALATALAAPRAGPYVRLSVQDSGTGMSQEAKSHLFEPFYTTKGLHGGTGLGLATVYGIVKQNAGCITVKSEPGRGTAVHVYLPRCLQRGELVSAPLERQAGGTETVLVVEDEPLVRSITLRTLKNGGYQVLVAGNAQEALEVEASGAHFDLLLTDFLMPGLNGCQLADEIGRRRPGVRVLLVSGYVQDMAVNAGSTEVAVAFLEKPFTPAALLARVRKVLDASHEDGAKDDPVPPGASHRSAR